jgi:hypothetical protein
VYRVDPRLSAARVERPVLEQRGPKVAPENLERQHGAKMDMQMPNSVLWGDAPWEGFDATWPRRFLLCQSACDDNARRKKHRNAAPSDYFASGHAGVSAERPVVTVQDQPPACIATNSGMEEVGAVQLVPALFIESLQTFSDRRVVQMVLARECLQHFAAAARNM